MDKPFYVYDVETFPNCFLFSGKFEDNHEVQTFEVSDYHDDRVKMFQWFDYLRNLQALAVGFNNLNFDYPVIHNAYENQYTFSPAMGYQKAMSIIQSQEKGFSSIPYSARMFPQVDLYKINHFDNKARATSLKALQVAMRSESVEDLPFPVGTHLTRDQVQALRTYNLHDVTETEKFLKRNKHLIKMRQELAETGVVRGDVINYSDVKIGVDYLVNKIDRGKCYSGSKPKQTYRAEIRFNEIILPKIFFRTSPYQEVLEWFRKQTLNPLQGDRPKLQVDLAGIPFDFGVGGVHASVNRRVFRSNESHVIKDIDVSGMYVAVAIANGFFPEHLGQDFVTAYKQLQSDRAQYPKGSTMNAVLKLAGNGVYGKSSDMYSCFYDPRYTFSVTVNGQLQILQLVEALSLIPGLEIIQANTDGITVYLPRKMTDWFDMWKSDWETMTGLKLEEVDYKAMWIRDCNNYVAEYMDET